VFREGDSGCEKTRAEGHTTGLARFRAKRGQLKTFLPARQDLNLALTVLHVPSLLDRGLWSSQLAAKQSSEGVFDKPTMYTP